MNKKIKGIIAAGSVLAVLASLVPLTSYAATDTGTVSVTVAPTISINPVANVTFNDVSFGNNPTTGTLSVTVTSNKAYHIDLSAATPALTSGAGDTIAAADSTNGSPLTGSATEGWGIKKKPTAGNTTDSTNFYGLTSTNKTFYTSNSGGVNTIEFTLGIAVAPTTPAGTYQTTVTVTADTNAS